MKQQFTDCLNGNYVKGKSRFLSVGLLSFAISAGLTATQSHAADDPQLNILSFALASERHAGAEGSFRYEVQVNGLVKDDKGMPLPGVTVVVKGTTIGAATDTDGKFSLAIPDEHRNGTLVFSYIGYAKQEVKLSGQAQVNVTMLTDAKALQEVVVVGYGTMEKKEVSSAVTTVTTEDFQKGAFNNPLQMIEGRVAGVTISNPNAADPNTGPAIQLRGASSLRSGNGPLIVIDGLPGGDLRNLAQQDIESISILRDAAAAAIYGSRGANGVVLVQTKRGKAGKVAVTYDSYVEHDRVAAKPDILSAEEFLQRGRDEDRGARTNWYDELLREDNFGQNHSLSVSGGSESTVFRL